MGRGFLEKEATTYGLEYREWEPCFPLKKEQKNKREVETIVKSTLST